jgi:hypothetical protein
MAFEQRPQAGDHLGGALVVGDDVGQDLAQLSDIRDVGLEELLGHVGADDGPAPERVGRPDEMLDGQDRRQRLDARLGPRHANSRRAVAVLVEVPAIRFQEGHHLAQGGFERRVQTAGFDVNELRGELRQQRLEPEAVLQKTLA